MNSPSIWRASGKASRLTAFLAAGALTAVACGGSTSTAGGTSSDTLPANIPDAPAEAETDTGGSAEGTETTAAPEIAADNLFAPVEVLEVNTQETFNFAETIGGGDKAVLLWFWAPH